MFKKILFATDGSRHAEEALKYTRDLAEQCEAQVIVVHAFEPIQLRSPYYEEAASRDEIISRHVTEGKRIANEAAQKLQEAGADVITEVREGPAADAILRVVNARQPDLIVMGSRGLGELSSLLLGSVSHRVLAHAQVPVMMVRAGKEEKG